MAVSTLFVGYTSGAPSVSLQWGVQVTKMNVGPVLMELTANVGRQRTSKPIS